MISGLHVFGLECIANLSISLTKVSSDHKAFLKMGSSLPVWPTSDFKHGDFWVLSGLMFPFISREIVGFSSRPIQSGDISDYDNLNLCSHSEMTAKTIF